MKVSWVVTFWTSMIGLAPDTVTVSSMEPTVICASTFAAKPELSSMPSRTKVEKPGRVKVTL